PAPDAVFVGGSGGALGEILSCALQANPKARLCVSAIALETLEGACREMKGLGLEPQVAQIAVSRTRAAGSLHLLMAQNPVFLISGARP
ncbi:MAG: cobalamin biosynthesis bifunctional protein CbiET, partial [Oscillospiraceae bacterium]|nr:cobalamin biosynthesis bifunctional protein CbiET [Oscillospiraceae bacterium]